MATIAIYSMKGGVGKTTLAVNLAWCSAMLSSRRTLLWDLDQQAAATFLMQDGKKPKRRAEGVYDQEIKPGKLIRPTSIERLDLLAADHSLRELDRMFFSFGKKKRLSKIIDSVSRDYDRIILDCPPGLTETSDQILRAADLVLVPVIPSPLSQRAFETVVGHIERNHKGRTAILPVYTMVDRRRTLHRNALEDKKRWPVIPYASAIEQMASHRAPVGAFAPQSPAGQAFAKLWRGVERKIAKL
ncbi:ParA family protein [Parasphingopyxis lamellibrachiae]|uniref:Cellulose biosynthesis protein BcsQ n=1 Tax=Parasphingopyxis lamellibrachiae TaxID=680125 RepID=A0A3D9FB51_9SPHN|nr:ParA family protein [Parasphingopyxis lamellibrachiae]RED15050.1 cellulose biosynthesis protein BcsQ [Parasphingopyxis lamellibrachiae]